MPLTASPLDMAGDQPQPRPPRGPQALHSLSLGAGSSRNSPSPTSSDPYGGQPQPLSFGARSSRNSPSPTSLDPCSAPYGAQSQPHEVPEVSERALAILDEDTWRKLGRPEGLGALGGGIDSGSDNNSGSANGSPLTKRRSSWLGPTSEGKSPDGKSARVSFFVPPPSSLRGPTLPETSTGHPFSSASASTGTGSGSTGTGSGSTGTGSGSTGTGSASTSTGSASTRTGSASTGIATPAAAASATTSWSKREAKLEDEVGKEEGEKEGEASTAERRPSFFGARHSRGVSARGRRHVSFEKHTSAGALAGTRDSPSPSPSPSDSSSSEGDGMDLDSGSSPGGGSARGERAATSCEVRCALAVQRAAYLGSRQGSPPRGRRMVRFWSEVEREAPTNPSLGDLTQVSRGVQSEAGSGHFLPLASDGPAGSFPCQLAGASGADFQLAEGEAPSTSASDMDEMRALVLGSKYGTLSKGQRLVHFLEDGAHKNADGSLYSSPQARVRGAAKLRALFREPEEEASMPTTAPATATNRPGSGRRGGHGTGFAECEASSERGNAKACGAACDDRALVNELRMMVLGSRLGSPSRCERGHQGALQLGELPRGAPPRVCTPCVPLPPSERLGVRTSCGTPRTLRGPKWPQSQSEKEIELQGTVVVERAKTVHGCRGEN